MAFWEWRQVPHSHHRLASALFGCVMIPVASAETGSGAMGPVGWLPPGRKGVRPAPVRRPEGFLFAGLVALALLPLALAASMAVDAAFAAPAVLGLLAWPAGWAARTGRDRLYRVWAVMAAGMQLVHVLAAPVLYDGTAVAAVNGVAGAALAVLPHAFAWAPDLFGPGTSGWRARPDPGQDWACLEKLTPDRAVIILDRDLKCLLFNIAAGSRLDLAPRHRGCDVVARFALFDRPVLLNALMAAARGLGPVQLDIRLADAGHPLHGGRMLSVRVDRFAADQYLLEIEEAAHPVETSRTEPGSIAAFYRPVGAGPPAAAGTEAAAAARRVIQAAESGRFARFAHEAAAPDATDAGGGEGAQPGDTGHNRDPAVIPAIAEEDKDLCTGEQAVVRFTRSYSQYDPAGATAVGAAGWH